MTGSRAARVEETEITRAARALLEAVLPKLERDRVIPPPRTRIYIHVGRDYEGSLVMATSEYIALKALLNAVGFSEEIAAESSDGYIFSFLDAYVARAARRGRATSIVHEAAFGDCLAELFAVLRADAHSVACCRVVSNITTGDQQPLALGDLEIVPLVDHAGARVREMWSALEAAIPGSFDLESVDLRQWAETQSILVTRRASTFPWDTCTALGSLIERFILVVRLLYSNTSHSHFEIQGSATLVGAVSPHLVQFRGNRGSLSIYRVDRSVTLTREDAPRIEGVSQLLGLIEERPPEVLVRSIEVAIRKFAGSFHTFEAVDQVVDLVTALEAALAGDEGSDVSLRIRTRAASLLVTDNDAAPAIFDDLRRLYDLRSRLIHGGTITSRSLRRTLAISTKPSNAVSASDMEYAVDRLRDLARRAILMRLCLGTGDDATWPLASDENIDNMLADDDIRRAWRYRWHLRLAAFGAATAARRAPTIARGW